MAMSCRGGQGPGTSRARTQTVTNMSELRRKERGSPYWSAERERRVLSLASRCRSRCERPSVDNLGDLRGQRQEPAKPRALGPRCAAGQAQPREPAHRPQQGNLCFQSRNPHARACVRSRGEGEMAIRPASNIEPIRVGKLFRIAVSCADAQRQVRIRLKRHTADGNSLTDESVAELVGTLQAQTLLDRGSDQLRLGSETVERLGVVQQQIQAVANEVRGRLMPGIQEKHAVLQQLGLRQFSFLQQPGQQIGLPQRTAPAVGNQAPQISRKFNHRLVAARVLFGSELGFQGAKNRQGPAAQRTAILTRDAQQVANHLDRDGGGEVLDEIEMLPLLQLLEQPVDQCRDTGLQGSQCVGTQRTDDLASHAGVVRGIIEYQTRRVMLVQWRAQAEFGAKYRLLVGTEVAPVSVDLVKIGKPAEKVAPIRTAMYGLEGAQRGVNVVRILIKVCVQPVRIERLSDDVGLLGVHGAVQTRADRCPSNPTTAPGSSMWALWPAPGISQDCGRSEEGRVG